MNKQLNESARIFLIDDHPAVLEGLSLLLAQEQHVVCGEASCLAEMHERLDACMPDIVVLDLSLCEESGLDALPELLRRGIPALVYSMHEDSSTIKRVLERGASGYITKREKSTVLLEALRCVLAGERYISPRTSANLDDHDIFVQMHPQAPNLSERESQIIALLAKGLSNVEIALTLGVSVRTVETYCARILAKLPLDGMKALRKYAIQVHRTMPPDSLNPPDLSQN